MTNFENITEPLNDLERSAATVIAKTMRQYYVGAENACTASKIGTGMANTFPELRYTDAKGNIRPYLTDVRIRKIMNYILRNHLVRYLIASSNGYYVARNASEVCKYIQSLEERIDAINAMKQALKDELNYHVA